MSPAVFHIARGRPKRNPAAMHEMAPAPGETLMSADATRNASQVSSVTMRGRSTRTGHARRVRHASTLRAAPPRQYLTLHPYGVVLATVTGLPVVASVSAART